MIFRFEISDTDRRETHASRNKSKYICVDMLIIHHLAHARLLRNHLRNCYKSMHGSRRAAGQTTPHGKREQGFRFEPRRVSPEAS